MGLNDFGARFYDPGLGVFLSVDPLLADPTNLMDQNPYAYARGNPVSFVDIGGLATSDCPGDACFQYGGGGNSGGGNADPPHVPFNFVGGGHINAGGSWGWLKNRFHGLRGLVKSGYQHTRDGVRSAAGGGDEGSGSHPSPVGGDHSQTGSGTGSTSAAWGNAFWNALQPFWSPVRDFFRAYTKENPDGTRLTPGELITASGSAFLLAGPLLFGGPEGEGQGPGLEGGGLAPFAGGGAKAVEEPASGLRAPGCVG